MKLRECLHSYLSLPIRLPSTLRRGREVRASVFGTPIAFRCAQADLVLSAEALGSAFLLPAASKGWGISGRAADPVWLEGAGQILDTAGDWWGWQAEAPRFRTRPAGVKRDGGGQAFSLGVDSFYTLFFADALPSHLVIAGGFDVPVTKTDILGAMCESVAEVAEAIGAKWLMLETDLRRHPLFRELHWERSHGGALAMLGHLLQDAFGTFSVSSSFQLGHLGPWGSHPDLDPLWSSSHLRIQHFGQQTSRLEKLRRLVQHPMARELVRRHLRVCWVAPSENGNCGKCRKCLLLRASLEIIEPGYRLRTMPAAVDLVGALDSLAPVTDLLVLSFWRELRGGADRRLEKAICDLVARSEMAFDK
ncbi:MAG: hypothetical protein PHD19_03245 [Dechloromonas sp.]|nr:hypothetical protein [Dechloromonas sp.]